MKSKQRYSVCETCRHAIRAAGGYIMHCGLPGEKDPAKFARVVFATIDGGCTDHALQEPQKPP